MQYIARNCPVCHESNGILKMQSATPSENMDWNGVQESWRGLLKEKTFFSYHKCAQCGLSYAPRYFSDEQLNKLYGAMAPNMDDVNVDQLKATQQGYFGIVKKYLTPGLTGGYLELGPDVGYFAAMCSESEKFSPYWFIEPNLAVWDQLNSKFADREIKLLAVLDALDSIPDESLGLVVAIHVMDHLTMPREILEKIRKKMKSDGVFLAVTHDEGSLLAKLLGPRWPPYCLQHPQLYNRKTITRLFESSDFVIKSVTKSVNHFPMGFLVQQGCWAFFKFHIKRLRILDSLNVRLRLGNIATIAMPGGRT